MESYNCKLGKVEQKFGFMRLSVRGYAASFATVKYREIQTGYFRWMESARYVF